MRGVWGRVLQSCQAPPPPCCSGGSPGSPGCKHTQAVCRSTRCHDRHCASLQHISGGQFGALSFRGAMLFAVYSRELSEPLSVTAGLSVLHWL